MFRQWQRSVITMAAIVIATLILIIMSALIKGLLEKSISGFTDGFIGQIQVHHPDFREEHSLYQTIENPDAILKDISSQGLQASPRNYGGGLIAKDDQSAGIMIIGISPEQEQATFNLTTKIAQGSYLNNSPSKQVILGKKLAHTLQAKIGSEIILLVSAADGSLGNDIFYVSGILKSMGDEFDRSLLIMHKDDFDDLFASPGFIHEIAIKLPKQQPLDISQKNLQTKHPNAEIITWTQLLPALSEMLEVMDVMMLIFYSFFALGAALGVLNTILMTNQERIREYGLLKAIGTSSTRIFWQCSLEAAFLGLIGSIVGVVLAFFSVLYLNIHGLDMSSWMQDVTMLGITIDPIWRAEFSLRPFIEVPIIMIIISWLISVYPARVATRINIVKALHYE